MIRELIAASRIYDWIGKRSYAQAGEDMICRALFGDRRGGSFVDIGAYHPKQFSNTYYFYKKGWRGLAVEPNGNMVTLWSCRPGDKVVQALVGKKNGWGRYFRQAEATRNGTKKRSDSWQKIKMWTLKSLLDKYWIKGKGIDLLSVDTEGSDMEILRTNDWRRYRPEVIVVEEVVPSELKKWGYKLVGMTGYSQVWKRCR